MSLPRFVVQSCCIAMVVLESATVSCQEYPSKPVRVVTSDVGGGNDFAARLISPGLSENLGQQVTVENRAGAGGIIAIQTVAKAPPDGYTLLLYSGTMWTLPLLRNNVPYDPVKDFSTVTLMVRTPQILVVHPSLPVKSVKDLIALAKAKPGKLNYSSAGTGGANHIAMELFKSMAGVNIVHVPYKGTGPAITGLIGGEVQIIITNMSGIAQHVESGRLRALAVTSSVQSALFPSLPTVAVSLPGYESVSITGMFAPAGTAAALIRRLNQEIVRVLDQAKTKERFFNAGAEVVGSSPEQLAATMKAEMARLGKVIKGAGIRAD